MTSLPHPSRVLYVGLDIHKETHAAVATDCFGEQFFHTQIKNQPKEFASLLSQVQEVALTHHLTPRWGLEDTGGNGAPLATFLAMQGEEVYTVNPVLVTRLRRQAPHPEKSDLKDAEGVAKVLVLGRTDTLPLFRVSDTTRFANALKELLNERWFLVKEQTKLKNHLHTLLTQSYGLGYRSLFKNVFSTQALHHWQCCPSSPERLKNEGLTGLLESQVQRTVKRLLYLRENIKEIEEEVASTLRLLNSPLETLSGCGPLTTAALLAEIGDIARFSSSAKLAKYAGLTPTEHSSGKMKRQYKSRSGNRQLNLAFHRVALSQISPSGSPIARSYYERKVQEGKQKMQALAALKRRLADIVYALLKNNVPYDISRHIA